MKLILKFNLVFIAIFLIGLGAAGYVSNQLLQKNAREEILQNARLVMETALATRAYTSSQVRPLLETQMKYTFLPQSVPVVLRAPRCWTACARSSPSTPTRRRRSTRPTRATAPSTGRPTSSTSSAPARSAPRSSASATRRAAARSTSRARSRSRTRGCLPCHSTVDAAPKTLVEKYGPANGFGWKLNEVIGAQIVSVPTEVPIARAQAAFRTFMVSLTAVFVFIGIALNLMLLIMVIRPVTQALEARRPGEPGPDGRARLQGGRQGRDRHAHASRSTG